MQINSIDDSTRNDVNEVLEFYTARCKGELLSNSQFVKWFVKNHKEYK